jgi:hypothetical protein
MDWNVLGPALLSLLPPLGMVVVVYILFKSLIGADAKERKVRAKIELEERAKAAKAKAIKP